MKKFIDANKSYFLSSIIFSLVFLLILFIYRLDIRISIYGIILYCGVSLPIVIYRYSKYNLVIETLKYLEDNTFEEDYENIKFENNELERSYHNLYLNKNKQLVEEKERNSKLYNEQNEYLTMWVHQVKTPISTISLISEREENNEVKMELLRVNEYIDQMINYMKFENLSQDYVFRNISLKKIINNSIKKYKLFFFKKKLFVDINIDDIDILTDEKWLSYVIQQIIFNGIKYIEKGGIKIYNEKNNPHILHIEDTGIGIPENDLQNITKWGYTGENGRLDKNSTGIGLYLVDKILDKFKYSYKIHSEVNKGTDFIINLKRREIIEN
ncbi:sensor histidine kinase [Miniphocaeibacter halophilus]|uniref:Sensor histidine kinase n=1 Tax=Miniphocaeibacter halophilus TaxID=2931922 RepID=A0AC61MQZ8_9FIRM|nr:sensor histidine kinase [Miniphocaeibacter halophilus]QQK07020.1 sensor histidine kinase [Miniphocaeibacter halophilus]